MGPVGRPAPRLRPVRGFARPGVRLAERAARLVIDRRVDNARQLHAVVLGEAGSELAADRQTLEAARQALARIQTDAMASAGSALPDQDVRRGEAWGRGVPEALHAVGRPGGMGGWRCGRV